MDSTTTIIRQSHQKFGDGYANITIPADFSEVKLEYDANSNLIYVGKNDVPNASEDNTNWVITKLYYDENGNLVATKTRRGAWSNRNSLFP